MRFIADHPLPFFFLFNIPFAWFWWLQIWLRVWPEQLALIPSSLGATSPILSVWLIDKVSGSNNLAVIFQSVKEWRRVAPQLFLAALAFPFLDVAGKALSYVMGFEAASYLKPGPAELGLSLLLIIPITFFSGLITSPLLEEPGWRGYALPRLQAMYGRNVASLVLGSYWWLWHQMMNMAFGLQPSVTGYLSMLGQSFLIDSLYLASNSVILVAMFAHQSMFIVFNFLSDPGSPAAQYISLALLWAVVVLLRIRPTLSTRRNLRRKE